MSMSVYPVCNAAQQGSVAPPLVSALGNGDTNSAILSSVKVGVRFATDGEEYEFLASGPPTATIGTWLDQGVSSDVWVEHLRTSGTETRFADHPNATRINIALNANFTLTDTTTGDGAKTITGTFKFWDAASGGNVLDTTSSAQYSANRLVDMCPTCCFTPWTLITMANGLMARIVDIREGDLIQVEDGVEPVKSIITRTNRVMYRITFADGRGLELSEDHPLYVEGKGYSAINPDPGIDYKDLGIAEPLLIGDKVRDVAGNSTAIKIIDCIEYPSTVYTLENSKFYANGLLVY